MTQTATEFARFPNMNPGPVMRVDREGFVLMANPAAFEAFGDGLVGKCWPDTCPGMDDGAWEEIRDSSRLIAVEAHVRGRDYVFRHRRDSGSEQVFVYGADITELKQVQEALRLSEKKMAELARFPDMNPGPVLRTDAEGTVLLANRAAVEAFGTELAGKCWWQVCPGISPAAWKGIVASKDLTSVEARAGRCDYVFRHRSDPQTDLVFIYGSDVTELKAVQGALERSRQQIAEQARFPEMNPGPVMRVDYEGAILMANRAALDVFGRDLVGRNWPRICPGMDYEGWKRIVTSPSMVPVEAGISGREYVFRHRHDEPTKLIFVYGADITELKEAQRALRQSEKLAALGKLSAGLAHELNNPAAAAKRAAGQLAERLLEVERLSLKLGVAGLSENDFAMLSGIRAELIETGKAFQQLGPLDRSDREEAVTDWLDRRDVNEPWMLSPQLAALGVNRLEAIAEKLRPEALSDALAWVAAAAASIELVETISASAGSMSELVSAVKSYSHMDRAPEQEVDIHDGLESTLRILAHKFKKGTRIERDYDRTLPKVMTLAGEVNQVWTNLIDNAVDAAGPQGIVTIKTRREGDRLVVEIIDNGPGIPPSLQPRIFEPFFTTKDVGQGTGLGLDTARRIVTERLKGEIGFNSISGNTCFRVRLPLQP